MPKDTLNEREFELINILGPKISLNQRNLSRHMDLSLGMTNMLIRRLIAKGFIRIRQLNKKKVEYILTPKGFSEKMRKSVNYTLKTINSIGLIKEKLRSIIGRLYETGERHFYILGGSDLVLLVEMIIQETPFSACKITRIQDLAELTETDGVVLICRENVDKVMLKGRKAINLVEELAKMNGFTYERGTHV